MNNTNTAHLVSMANQIATNMQHGCNEQEAVEKVKKHIDAFWATAMKTQITSELNHHENELHPIALNAIKTLKTS